ncbi:MAG: hypothetical protein ACPL1Z_06040 [Candidatus Bathyarchaeales archaeon]
MGTKNRRTQRKINLLEMSDIEKAKIIEQLKQNLRRSISEAKLWKTLLQYETVTVNGQVVFSGEDSLNGLLMPKTNL